MGKNSLKYNFDKNGYLEIYLTNLNSWYRTTRNTFRSFNGMRRVDNIEISEDIFISGTNKIPSDLSLYKNEIYACSQVSKKTLAENMRDS
jgi:hypothetical protein